MRRWMVAVTLAGGAAAGPGGCRVPNADPPAPTASAAIPAPTAEPAAPDPEALDRAVPATLATATFALG